MSLTLLFVGSGSAGGGAGPSCSFEDFFNRSNADPMDGDWTVTTTDNEYWQLTSNQAHWDSENAGDSTMYYDLTSSCNNHFAQATFVSTSSATSNVAGVAIRINTGDSTEFFVTDIQDDGGQFYVAIYASPWTFLDWSGSGGTYTTGLTLYIEAVGTSVEATYNARTANTTNATRTGDGVGLFGLAGGSFDAVFDSFVAGAAS